MSERPGSLALRFVDAGQIQRILTFPRLIAAFEAAHRRPKIEVQDGFLGSEGAQYFVRHAVDRGRYFGSKLITSFPGNLAGSQLPAVQAVCVLFDGSNGRPLAVIDGTEITYWRTAADSALGASFLAPANAKTLLVVGAGQMCSWLVRAHKTVRPSIQHVWIWNRTHQRGDDVAALLRREGIDAQVQVVHDLDAATRVADIISTCTRSHEPLIRGKNLKAGVHLDLVGGYTPETREADDDAARCARVFVDRFESAFAGVGDILQPIANGAIARTDVLGDLYDLAGGRIEGRRSPDEITLFKNAGGGHLDLMAAELICQELGIGAR